MSEIYVCTYELRQGTAVSSTGRITLEERPEPGSLLRLGHERVRVEDVSPASGGELHLVLAEL